MSTSAAPGFGSIISYSNTSGGSYAKIGQSVDLDTPMTEVGDIKTTNNDSLNNSHEYLPGLTEPGDVEFEVVYFKSIHSTIMPLAGNQTVYYFKETFPDATVCYYPGYFKQVGIATKTEDQAMKGKFKIKLTTAAQYS